MAQKGAMDVYGLHPAIMVEIATPLASTHAEPLLDLSDERMGELRGGLEHRKGPQNRLEDISGLMEPSSSLRIRQWRHNLF